MIQFFLHEKTYTFIYIIFLLVLHPVFQNTPWTLSVGCFSVSWEKQDCHSASCLCQEECDIHGGGRVFFLTHESAWGSFYTVAFPRLLLSPCSQERGDSCPYTLSTSRGCWPGWSCQGLPSLSLVSFPGLELRKAGKWGTQLRARAAQTPLGPNTACQELLEKHIYSIAAHLEVA